jgi:hypothetical protein
MKCISIKQPWAWLIFHGKPVENRSWPSKYRGTLLIHAAMTFDRVGEGFILGSLKTAIPEKDDLTFGAIIGQVDMIDCVKYHPSPYFCGPYGHVYEKPVIFEKPIPYKGKLGIFDVPDEIIKEVPC